MYRVELPMRHVDDPALNTAAYKSQNNYWWEGVAYEITQNQASDLHKAANNMLDRYAEAMDYVVSKPSVLKKFYFVKNRIHNYFIQGLAAHSWKTPSERSYAIDRWDIGWDGINPPKLLERNFGHLGLIVGTGVVQERYISWLKKQPGYGDVKSFGNLRQHFIRAFREVSADRGIARDGYIAVIGQAEGAEVDKGMVEAGTELARWTTSAGFRGIKYPIRNISCMSDGLNVEIALDRRELLMINGMRGIELGYFTDGVVRQRLGTPANTTQADGSPFSLAAAYPFVGFQNYAYDLARFHGRMETVNHGCPVMQPAWTLLMSHKAMLPILHQLYPDHENFLPTVAGNQKIEGQKSFVKHVNGQQGIGAKVRSSDGNIIDERHYPGSRYWDGYNNPRNYVTQAYCDAVLNPDGSHKVLHMFTTNGRPAAIGMREGPSPFVGGDNTQTRFIPVIVRDKPSTDQSVWSYKPLFDDECIDLNVGCTVEQKMRPGSKPHITKHLLLPKFEND